MIYSVTEFLDRSAEKYPDKVCFMEEDREITFGELRNKAIGVAQVLIDAGIRKSPVAICETGTIDCIVWMMGVAYSANFYCLIDMNQPGERIKKELEILDPMALIAREEFTDCEKYGCLFKPQDFESQEINERLVMNVAESIILADVAYIMFTSGSTGEPKGVVISHGIIIENIEATVENLCIDSSERLGVISSFEYAVQMINIYWIFAAGASGCIIPSVLFANPEAVLRMIEEHEVNAVSWSAAAISLFAEYKNLQDREAYDEETGNKKLNKVVTCGSAISGSIVKTWKRIAPKALFINTYGATESFGAAHFEVLREFADEEIVPIGRPYADTQLLLLNEDDKPVKGNESGNLYVRKSFPSYGYWRDKEKTEEMFICNPLNPYYTEWIYKTGDIARVNEDGNYEIVGRADLLFKHHGHRIQPEEIEKAATEIENVGLCAAYLDKETDQIVLAYEGNANQMDVMRELKEKLPQYMMPGRVEANANLPRTENGKIARGELGKCSLS